MEERINVAEILKDLCTRLPYGVVVKDRNGVHKLTPTNTEFIDLFNGKCNIAPYLFPLSSINEAQCYELIELFNINIEEDYIKFNEVTGITFFLQNGFDIELHLTKLLDWLNKNHFDYYDLISIGLAIDATNLNIY